MQHPVLIVIHNVSENRLFHSGALNILVTSGNFIFYFYYYCVNNSCGKCNKEEVQIKVKFCLVANSDFRDETIFLVSFYVFLYVVISLFGGELHSFFFFFLLPWGKLDFSNIFTTNILQN